MAQSRKITKHFFLPLSILLGTVVLFCLAKCFPHAWHVVYTKGFFQLIRFLYDYTLGLLPFPPILLIALVMIIYRIRNKPAIQNGKERLFKWLGRVCWLAVAFFWLWGFHYAAGERVTLASSKPSDQELFDWTLAIQTQLENQMPVHFVHIPESEIRHRLESYLQSQQWPVYGRARSRSLHDGGMMRWLGISGIYLPWLMEGHMSSSLPVEVHSFVQAHEMAHGYGIAREGEADFCAYKSLIRPMNNTYDQMAIWMANYELWSVLRRVIKNKNPLLFNQLDAMCPIALRTRHEAVKANFNAYSTEISQVAQQSNDAYLKTMGMQKGIEDYDTWWLWAWSSR